MWKHQEESLQWARETLGAYGGGILALPMGAGKTRVALTLCATVEGKCLIFTPRSVLPVWQQEFNALGINKRFAIADGAVSARLENVKSYDIIATNYEALSDQDFRERVRKYKWELVIYDECHRLKAPGGVWSHAAKRIPATWRLGLTGTLMPHSPLDVYGQLRAVGVHKLIPHCQSWAKFKERYAVCNRFGHVIAFQNLSELTSLAPYVFTTVLEPHPCTQTERYVYLPPKALDQYGRMEREFVAELPSGDVVVAPNVLARLQRLIQIASGWQGLHSAKDEALAEILGDLPSGEPVVVFCRYNDELNRARKIVGRSGRMYFELSGLEKSLELWKRYANCGAVLGVQVQAGSLGISLVESAYAVFWTLPLSLGEYEQAVARLARSGQERTVTVVRLIAVGTVDEYIALAHKRREETLRFVIDKLAKGGTRK